MLLTSDALHVESRDELFIREAHHKIANSLQLASSFLRLRAHRTSSDEVRDEFMEMATRLAAVGLLHRRLCSREDDDALVNLNDYIRALCSDLGDSIIGANGAEFRLDPGDGDAVQLRSHSAAMVGIVVTELLTNSVKHGGKRPICTIGISTRGNLLCVNVSDDGPGFCADHLTSAEAGIGFDLVYDLVSRLKGTLGMQPSTRGAHFVLTLPKFETSSRVIASRTS